MIDTSTTTWVVDPDLVGDRRVFNVEQVTRWVPTWLSHLEAEDLADQREVWWLYNLDGLVLGWDATETGEGLIKGRPWKIDVPCWVDGTVGSNVRVEVQFHLLAIGATPPSEFISEIYPWKDQA